MANNNEIKTLLGQEGTNSKVAIISDDWNLLAEDPGGEERDITSNLNDDGSTRQDKSKAEDKNSTLSKIINKTIQKKRKIILMNPHKGAKRDKIIPVPNLARARPNVKHAQEEPTTDLPASKTSTKIDCTKTNEDLVAKNNFLKAEIQKLAKQVEELREGRRFSLDLPTQNRFETLDVSASTSLAQEEEMESQDPSDFLKYLKRKNKQQQENNSTKKSGNAPRNGSEATQKDKQTPYQPKDPQNTPGRTKRKERPPPINILYQDHKDTTKLLKENLKDMNNFYIKRLNSGKHTLQVDNIDNFKQAKELLTKCNSSFYTYTFKAEKPITLLLKGLDNSYEKKEILDELCSLSIENVEFKKVTRFTTSKSRQEKRLLPIFVVQLSPESEVNKLKKIKYLFHQIIYWEKLMRRETIQCKKCQRIGHAAANCNLPYRCVKCDKKHGPGGCDSPPGTFVDRVKLFCVNCNKFGHSASYRGCPIILENKKKLSDLNKDTKKGNKVNTRVLNKSLIQPGVSYAETTRNKITVNNVAKHKETDSLLNSNRIKNIYDTNIDNTIGDALTEIKCNIAKLEKMVEGNSARINTIASLLERLLSSNE